MAGGNPDKQTVPNAVVAQGAEQAQGDQAPLHSAGGSMAPHTHLQQGGNYDPNANAVAVPVSMAPGTQLQQGLTLGTNAILTHGSQNTPNPVAFSMPPRTQLQQQGGTVGTVYDPITMVPPGGGEFGVSSPRE